MPDNGAEKPEPQIGQMRQNGLVFCGCPDNTELWFLTDAVANGQTIIQCSACKRNVGWARAQKREPLIQVPSGRM